MRIYLRFMTTNSFTSRMIRLLTSSEWSHVDLLIKTPTSKILSGSYVSAQAPDGVKIRAFGYVKPTKEKILYAEVPDLVGEKITRFIINQLDKPYDYTALAGILVDRNWQDDDSWFCSELIAAAFAHAGWSIIRGNVHRITPGMLAASPFLKELEGQKK